jgi:5-hydroxyisourate hydrolase-like protein (transthyretin family)
VLEDLIEGGYMLKAQAGAWTVETVVDVPTGTPDLVLHAAPRGAIFGRVIVADTRAPVSEFRLIVRDAHPTHPELGEELSRSELEGRADGSFRIEGLAAGRYVVEASATGFASSFSDPVEVEWGGSARVGDVALGRGATLLGHVVDAYTKEPVVGAEVATHENHWTEANAALFGALFNSALTKTTVTTDRDGRFSVDHMTPGDYQVRVRCAGYFDVVWNDVTLHQGVVTDVRRLELQRGGSIAGVVLAADGSAAPGVDLSLRNVEGNVYFARLRSDASGRFELGTCAPGIYALWADPLPEAPPDKPRAEARVAVVDRGEHAVELHLLDAAPSGSSSSY